MSIKKVTNSITSDKTEWRNRMHVADPNQSIENPQLTPKILGLRLGCCCIYPISGSCISNMALPLPTIKVDSEVVGSKLTGCMCNLPTKMNFVTHKKIELVQSLHVDIIFTFQCLFLLVLLLLVRICQRSDKEEQPNYISMDQPKAKRNENKLKQKIQNQ